MKKIILLALFFVSGFAVSAQEVFSLGPKMGYNSNTLTNNFDSIRSGINNSLQVGAFMRIGSKVYFQPEANYQVVKGNLNKTTSSSILRQNLVIHSLKVPLLLGIKLVRDESFNMRIMAGPAYTFLYNKELNPAEMNEFWPIHSVDDLKNSIWSFQMGAGFDVLFMTLDVRYEFGIDNMYQGSSNFKLKQNTFNVSLGVKLL